MAGRNWRDEARSGEDYWAERSQERPNRSSDYYGRSGTPTSGRGDRDYGSNYSGGPDDWDYNANPRRRHYYEGGDWGSDRGGGPGDYGQQFARTVRRDDYGANSPDMNPFRSNRSFEYDDWDHPGQRNNRRDYSGYGDWNRGSARDYGRQERGGAFWNSDADNRGDWELNRRSWSGRDYGGGHRDERGFFERASDELASWFGDEDAERRRHQDHHRGRGPRNYTRSGDRIREDVNDRLTDDWRVDASDIEVTVSGSEVTLSGTVTSRDQRRRAEDIAESVSGVTHVQNNLRVKTREQSWSGSNTNQGSSSGMGTLGSTTGTSSAGGVGGVGSTNNRT